MMKIRNIAQSLAVSILATLMLHFSAPTGFAQQVAPDQIVVDAKNWSDVYKAYQHFGKKADGVVAGAFTDKVSTLLAERWDLLDELRVLGAKDKRFMKFVMSNINEAVPANLGKTIRENATNQCSPKEHKQLCQKIIQSLERASKR